MKWLERITKNDVHEVERSKILLQLSGESKRCAIRKVGAITRMNQKINRVSSEVTHQRFLEDPEEWYKYHKAYSEVRKNWEVIPFQEAIEWCKLRPKNLVIGDFGCGEAFLVDQLENKVYSFDHVAINEKVIACDLSNVPLGDEVLDLAVFSLSLMGTNFIDYLIEAKRCLKLDGHLWIAEPTDRFKDIEYFKDLVYTVGFDIRELVEKRQFTFIKLLKSSRDLNKTALECAEYYSCFG